MKKTLIAITAALAAACGCNRLQEGEGSISLDLRPADFVMEVSKGNVGDYTTLPAAADFDITLTNYAGAVAWSGKFSAWDPTAKFAAGEYEIKATYGDPDEEGFDKPCFEGLKEFVVIAYESRNVSIEPTLSNCIVKVTTGEYFKKVFSSWSFNISTGLGNSFQLPENKGIFIDAFKFTLEGTFVTTAGKNVNFSKEFTGLESGTLYTVSTEVNNVEGSSFTISFNDQTETISIEEELN
ncbi:MAG: DUF4493 domain-containing protein [Bacteroidales bacterium]|nr:DUF4493 domain-containing protein [Bacteroidales bacterium]